MSQRGGRYTNNLEAGSIAGFAQIDKVACQPNPTNPLNVQRGGVGLVGASDTGVYEASTARYTAGLANPIISSTGVPLMINQPMNSTLISKACVQTAGRRRHRRRHSKNCKCGKHRKSRKNRN